MIMISFIRYIHNFENSTLFPGKGNIVERLILILDICKQMCAPRITLTFVESFFMCSTFTKAGDGELRKISWEEN